jgi:hypothetical protein
MVSRVFFTLDIDGRRYTDLFVDVKQTVGSSFEAGPIEVAAPKGAEYEDRGTTMPFDLLLNLTTAALSVPEEAESRSVAALPTYACATILSSNR